MKIWVLIGDGEGDSDDDWYFRNPNISDVVISDAMPDTNPYSLWVEATLPEEYEIWRK